MLGSRLERGRAGSLTRRPQSPSRSESRHPAPGRDDPAHSGLGNATLQDAPAPGSLTRTFNRKDPAGASPGSLTRAFNRKDPAGASPGSLTRARPHWLPYLHAARQGKDFALYMYTGGVGVARRRKRKVFGALCGVGRSCSVPSRGLGERLVVGAPRAILACRCTQYLYTVHIHSTCTQYMYTVHVQRICVFVFASSCTQCSPRATRAM